ncbi:ankyrin repeat-containing [Cordyceps militaris]|uniref:Ankyrin repeat-containing n=1 Tax=Cordyceps militaris TaxID=73501 RepID=A0A2H4SCU0_CORMI|nr:ankyrin repeat-containing [Cordyceps militaris]
MDAIGDRGFTLLSQAASAGSDKIVELLLNTEQYDVNSKDDEGTTPLIFAIHSGKASTVKLILGTRKADAERTGKLGQTSPGCTALLGNEMTAEGPVESRRVDVNASDVYMSTPLHWAVYLLQPDADGMEVEARNSTGCNALAGAVQNRCDIVELLLAEEGIDVNLKDCSDKTPLSLLRELPESPGRNTMEQMLSAAGGVADVFPRENSLPRLQPQGVLDATLKAVAAARLSRRTCQSCL